MKNKFLIRFIAEIAIFSALGLALDFLCGILSGFIWPNGGSVSIAMIPIFIMGYKYGPKGGFLTGFLIGTIQLFWGYLVNPAQVLLDYILAYTVLGAASLFTPLAKTDNLVKKYGFISLGIVVGCLLRIICATLAGYYFWDTGFIASLTYNASYVLISMVICIPLTCILIKALKNFMKVDVK